MTNILVTGGTGFLGSRIVSKLENEADTNVYVASKSTGVDILDYEKFKHFVLERSVDAVVHCAALSGGIAINYDRPVDMIYVNTMIGLNVVKACNEVGIKKMISVLPNCVYPGGLDEYEESKFWDGAMHESVVTVGIPRKTMWGLCFAYCRQDPTFRPMHLIFPNMYGPSDHFDPIVSHALGALIAKIIDAKRTKKKSIEIWGTGKPIREWLYVDDGAEAVTQCLKSYDKFIPNDIMNVGIGKGISIKDTALLIKDIVKWDGEFVYDLSKPDGSFKKILNCEKMRSLIEWEPTTSFESGVRQTIQWYESNL